MVRGLDKFREQFRAYANQYVLIGGAACNLLMEEAGPGPDHKGSGYRLVRGGARCLIRACFVGVHSGRKVSNSTERNRREAILPLSEMEFTYLMANDRHLKSNGKRVCLAESK